MRSTDCWACDAVDGLLAEERFDDAIALCRWYRKRFQTNDDGYARWTVELAEVFSRQQLASKTPVPDPASSANRPIWELIQSYPDHPRRLFLDWSMLKIEEEAFEFAVARAALSQHDQSLVETSMRGLVRTADRCLELATKVNQTIQRGRATSTATRSGQLDDLRRLERELRVASVSAVLLQTELFPRLSDDYVSAATQAELVCDQTLLKLPSSSKARFEIGRMRVEAILRQGDAARARTELDRLASDLSSPWPGELLALDIRIHLATGRHKAAGQRLATRARDSTTLPSLALDLARLEWLIATNQPNRASEWIEQIEKRNGRYARRRAEVVALSLAPKIQNGADGVGLKITRAHDLIRRGETELGAQVLTDAAFEERNPEKAIKHAITAAAAWKSAGQTQQAAELLEKISTQHSSAPMAPSTHLQGLLLRVEDPGVDVDLTQTLESSLRRHLRTWNDRSSSQAARSWLINLLEKSGQSFEAAIVATELHRSEIGDQSVEHCVARWRSVFRSDNRTNLSSSSQAADSALRSIKPKDTKHAEFLTSVHRKVAAMWLDAEHIKSLPPPSVGEPAWIGQCLYLRQHSLTNATKLEIPRNDQQIVQDVRWRLLRDGEKSIVSRSTISKFLLGWQANDLPPIQTAKLQLWQNQEQAALDTFESLWDQDSNQQTLIESAKILQQHKSPKSQQKAIECWDRLAAGSKKNSASWHLAKLSAIDGLVRSGRVDEAKKRCRYVLLTTPNLSNEIRQEYQRRQTD